MELLQKLVEDIVVALHQHVGFGGEQVLQQSRRLQETDKLVDFSVMAKSTYGNSGSHNILE